LAQAFWLKRPGPPPGIPAWHAGACPHAHMAERWRRGRDRDLPSAAPVSHSDFSTFSSALSPSHSNRGIARNSSGARRPLKAAIRCLGLVLPFVFALQMCYINYVLATRCSRLCWAFLVLEVPLFLHMVRHSMVANAVHSGSFQWVVYCWLCSVKTFIIYSRLMADRWRSEEKDGETRDRVRMAACLMPAVYILMMCRTLLQWKHVTLDVVLLQDMAWHVIVDLVDMFFLLQYMYPDDINDGIPLGLISEYPDDVKTMRQVAGMLVFLGILFHQQSFPIIEYVGPKTATNEGVFFEGGVASGSTSSLDVAQDHSVVTGHSKLSLTSGASATNRRSSLFRKVSGNISSSELCGAGNRGQGVSREWHYGVDVVKARKRSAIVSIIFVDFPFLAIRTCIFLASLSLYGPSGKSVTVDLSHAVLHSNGLSVPETIAQSNTSWSMEDVPRPELDKWLVKNLICLLLQAAQLRFVQQADLEQSQKIHWREMRNSEAKASRRMHQGRRMHQDPYLFQAWEDMRRGPEEAVDEAIPAMSPASAAVPEVSLAPIAPALANHGCGFPRSGANRFQQRIVTFDFGGTSGGSSSSAASGAPPVGEDSCPEGVVAGSLQLQSALPCGGEKPQLTAVRPPSLQEEDAVLATIASPCAAPWADRTEVEQEVYPSAVEAVGEDAAGAAADTVSASAGGGSRAVCPRCLTCCAWGCARRCARCCARAQRRARSVSLGFVLHALMGLVAGWIIAKHDFGQSQVTLLLSLGKGPEHA